MKIKNISLKNILWANLLMLVLVFSFIFIKMPLVFAEDDYSDAIAVRIIPNPNHFSAQRWYQSQGFSGSPQFLIVDGYKAVRDGRTVYVSATNVVGQSLYTNIYLISYDQEADSQTVDIFGRILKNWKFNNNIPSDGHCFISKKSCYSNSDCPTGYVCGNDETGSLFSSQANKCVFKEDVPAEISNTPSCAIDSDCPSDLICDSLKAKIIRDVDRLEQIVVIKEKINSYYEQNNHYPILGAGTYLPNTALSTWPSWQNTFLNQIGLSGISDPVNKLGSCSDPDKKFDLNTCWNSIDNIFYSFSPPAFNNFRLPFASYSMAYVTNSNGSNYKLCATMETVLSGGINYNITDGVMSNNSCPMEQSSNVGQIGFTGSASNTPPYISDYSLAGESGKEFQGFIKAIDQENHPITWEVVGNNNINFSSWTPASSPELLSTNNPSQKTLKALKAGNPGAYNIKIRLTDSMGASSEQDLKIAISNPSGPQIIAGDVEHNLSYNPVFLNEIAIKTSNSLNSVKICSDSNLNSCLGGNQVYSIFPDNDCYSPTDFSPIGNNINVCLKDLSGGEYKLVMKGENMGATNLGVRYYFIQAVDSYNTTQNKEIKVDIRANDPIINFNNCLTITSLGDYYECEINLVNQIENATISIISNLPNGLFFGPQPPTIVGYLLQATNNDGYEIKVRATNQYGKFSEKSIILRTMSDCGTQLIQHAGGPWNSTGEIRNHQGFYKTVLVGNQCWLKDNINYGNQVLSSSTSLSDINVEKYCYENNPINCDIFGGLYNFSEALQIPSSCNNNVSLPACQTNQIIKGICPDGFRVPVDSDWYILEKYLKDSTAPCSPTRNSSSQGGGWECSSAGGKLKVGGESNFNSLFVGSFSPSSININNGFSLPINAFSNFWSSTNYDIDKAVSRHIKNENNWSSILRDFRRKNTSYSVRCIKDIPQCYDDSNCNYLGTDFSCGENHICSNSSIGGNNIGGGGGMIDSIESD